MANDTATMKLTLSYTDDGQTVNVPAKSLSTVDVPDGTLADVEIPIPLGSIGTGCTLLLIENDTGQDLKLEIAGAATPSHDLPDGACVVVLAANDLPAARKLTACSVHTSAPQVGGGRVRVYAFGDPE